MSEFRKNDDNGEITPFQQVTELVKLSGGITNVDPALLAEFGYTAIISEGLSQLRPIALIEKEEKEKKSLEPFPSFNISLKYSTEARTILTDNQFHRFNNLSRDIDTIVLGESEKYYHYRTIVGNSSKPLIALWDSLKIDNYETSNPVKSIMLDFFAGIFDKQNIFEIYTTDSYSRMSLTEPDESKPTIDDEDDFFDENIMIKFSKEYMSNIRDTILRSTASMTDEDLAVGYFDSWSSLDDPLTSESIQRNIEFFDPNIESYCKSIGILDVDSDPREYQNIKDNFIEVLEEFSKRGYTTMGEVMLNFVGEEITDRLGIENNTHSEIFKGVGSFRQAKDRLKLLSDELLAQHKKEIKQQKRAKSSTRSSEEHELIKERIKTAKEGIEKVNKIISPFIETFDLPSSYCKVFSSKLKDMIGIVGRTTDREEVFTFDAAKNSQVDQNAGFVSGDCTADKPLNFGSKSSLYNIKVYNSTSNHVGNIYMAEVINTSGEIIAWHIDAIQIPVYLDWDQASKSIRDALTTQAKTKSVKTISINGEYSSVSNYSHIAKSFLSLSSAYKQETQEYLIKQISDTPGAKAKDKFHSSLQLLSGYTYLRQLY